VIFVKPSEVLLTASEAAALFGVSPKQVSAWRRQGRITCVVTPGGGQRYREAELLALRDATEGTLTDHPDRSWGKGGTGTPGAAVQVTILRGFMIIKRICASIAASGLVLAGLLAIAGPAGAAPLPALPKVSTLSTAGYTATGRDFRYIQATITVPDWSPTGLEPHEYIQLAGNDGWVHVGITYHAGNWETYVASQNNSLFPVHYYLPISPLQPGDGSYFSIYFDQIGGGLHFAIVPPSTDGPPVYFSASAHHALFTAASALDDWTYTTGQPVHLPPFLNPFSVNTFLNGAITTYSGAHGSFTGPWTTSYTEATSNGLPFPAGAVRVSPSALSSDGIRPSDVFSDWAR
jgi:Helix-turn-helix domain